MKIGYRDIKDKLGEPKWYDEHGVPRYCKFAPGECGVYIDQAVLLEISCQNCCEFFEVAVTRDTRGGENEPLYFNYGDPPNHGCVGDTMSSETHRVLQFWASGRNDWKRSRRKEWGANRSLKS